ncbi:MAG: hypothetical protein Solumvirus2_25 [Solumvirus sp.]|uniref:Uncharacterized protein n=1 Tax=Solumvirus sp. TaxID=2487773 RepID=A0A3G5AGF6_9VIRU|nr:MAG: hypothetical protein Solumvirus2_25 [Solumvirus sp.]
MSSAFASVFNNVPVPVRDRAIEKFFSEPLVKNSTGYSVPNKKRWFDELKFYSHVIKFDEAHNIVYINKFASYLTEKDSFVTPIWDIDLDTEAKAPSPDNLPTSKDVLELLTFENESYREAGDSLSDGGAFSSVGVNHFTSKRIAFIERYLGDNRYIIVLIGWRRDRLFYPTYPQEHTISLNIEYHLNEMIVGKFFIDSSGVIDEEVLSGLPNVPVITEKTGYNVIYQLYDCKITKKIYLSRGGYLWLEATISPTIFKLSCFDKGLLIRDIYYKNDVLVSYNNYHNGVCHGTSIKLMTDMSSGHLGIIAKKKEGLYMGRYDIHYIDVKRKVRIQIGDLLSTKNVSLLNDEGEKSSLSIITDVMINMNQFISEVKDLRFGKYLYNEIRDNKYHIRAQYNFDYNGKFHGMQRIQYYFEIPEHEAASIVCKGSVSKTFINDIKVYRFENFYYNGVEFPITAYDLVNSLTLLFVNDIHSINRVINEYLY